MVKVNPKTLEWNLGFNGAASIAEDMKRHSH
jgi:hypothetical protein